MLRFLASFAVAAAVSLKASESAALDDIADIALESTAAIDDRCCKMLAEGGPKYYGKLYAPNYNRCGCKGSNW